MSVYWLAWKKKKKGFQPILTHLNSSPFFFKQILTNIKIASSASLCNLTKLVRNPGVSCRVASRFHPSLSHAPFHFTLLRHMGHWDMLQVAMLDRSLLGSENQCTTCRLAFTFIQFRRILCHLPWSQEFIWPWLLVSLKTTFFSFLLGQAILFCYLLRTRHFQSTLFTCLVP